MSYLQIQQLLIELGVTIILAIFGGAGAIEFQVAVKKPTRSDLEAFKNLLPIFLQKLYFHPHNSHAYDGSSNTSGIDYLLKGSSLRGVVIWILVVIGGIVSKIVYLLKNNTENDIYLNVELILIIISFLILLRVSFFGIKIKKSE